MAESSPTQDVDGSLNAGSDLIFDIECTICNSYGKIQEAEGYCMVCCKYLCTTCLNYHIVLSATKHHRIIAKENMPAKQGISSASGICTQRCQFHTDKTIEYFCRTHNILCCSACVTLKHKQCNDLIYIPAAAADLSNSQEFKDFQNKLDNLIKKSEYITTAAKPNIKLLAEYRAKALQEIEIYRQELNDELDKLKNELEHQAERIEAKETERMSLEADRSNTVLAELQRMSSDIKYLIDNKQHYKLFIDMKNKEDMLADIQDRLKKAADICVTVVTFQPNKDLQKLIQTQNAFGKLLLTSASKMKATLLHDINVKPPNNKATCNISSAAILSESKLVVLDDIYESVRLIDTENKHILSEYKTEKTPCGLAIVGKTQVAVTIPAAKKIQFLNSEHELRVDREITFDKPCIYVASDNDKLVVSFRGTNKIRILNMAGELIQTFASSSQDYGLSSAASCLSVSSFNQAIYATDWQENRVTMLDIDGNVRAVYKDADLSSPRHSTTDDTGMVYICASGSHNIHLLTPDCRKITILLSKRDGISYPMAVCYCKVTRRLYVTMHDTNTVKVFQLS